MVTVTERMDPGTEADAESEEEQMENEEGDKLQGFAGMGDVISKILEKPVTGNENLVLCKSKKSKKRKLEVKKEYKEKKAKEEKLAEHREMNHVIPTRGNAPKELLLRRIATKGVVKLLNAVSANQKLVSEKMKAERTEAGKSKAAEKVTQSDFMDLLKRKPTKNKKEDKKNKNVETEVKEEEEEGTNKKWDVLREDFMLGSSFKDWDKMESDQEGDEKNDISSDDDDDDV